jgi:hypothetical protein
LAGFDLGAFPELALQYDAVDLGPDFGNHVSARTAGQFGAEGCAPSLNRLHADFDGAGLWGPTGGSLFSTAG